MFSPSQIANRVEMSTYSQGEESRFSIRDLLFTKSDKRGVIQTANEAFQRVSVYSWDRLIGAPHKIVRHPETPKGVFHMLWSALEADEPIGAYIQNQAEDGKPYWVFATLLPVDDGYISLRVKASTEHLQSVIPIYEEARKREKAGDLTPEESANLIQSRIMEGDWTDYREFYSFCLRDEVVSRNEKIGHTSEAALKSLGKMFRSVRDLEKCAGKVKTTFGKTHQIPYNMRLQAGRLEGSDGPISVISANHRMMTQSLEDNIRRFSAESSLGADAIRLALFKVAVAGLVDDVAVDFAAEDDHGFGDKTATLDTLNSLKRTFREETLREVRALSDSVNRFGNRCRDMRRMMSGLELTRIMCKIERSKFDGDHSGLDEIVNRLADAQDTLGRNFDEILTSVADILQLSEQMQRDSQVDHERKVA